MDSFRKHEDAGLVVDVLGDNLTVVSSALWVEKHRDIIIDLLMEMTSASHVTWRSDSGMLAAERGLTRAEAQAAAIFPDTSDAPAESSDKVIVVEEGVKYATNPLGQKTGFYADQRDNRVFLRQLVRGKRVLDLCCYSGGFSINAALHGAVEVLGIDSSRSAIDLANENALLNSVADRCVL
jgi:23S rRNA G2069 N7-methylase RlmK/C1962 C5-methylase RlmI